MTDHQHNDNLEQFFRKNLEGYSPEPSGDFWARMEPVIPVKPPFRGGWLVTVGKWAGLALLAAAIVVAGVLWWNDRQQVEALTKLVQEQQREIEQIREQQGAGSGLAQAENGNIPASASAAPATNDRPFFHQNQNRFEKNDFEKSESSRAEMTGNQFFTKNNNALDTPVQSPETGLQGFATDAPESAVSAIETAETDDMPERSPLATPEILDFLNAQNLAFYKHAPSVKHHEFKGFEPYPRFSFEAGASAFVMPVRRLFEKDTVIFETGDIRPSLQTGLMVNFEMNSAWMFQTGFHFKNMRSENLSLRYNSFPLNLRRRWAWGRRNRLELKSGLALNTLINAKTFPEKIALPGLESSYFSWIGGGGIALPISESLIFVTEANLGLPLTPVANGKRPPEAGIYAGLRFLIR